MREAWLRCDNHEHSTLWKVQIQQSVAVTECHEWREYVFGKWVSWLMRETYCCLTRGIVFGLRSGVEVGGEEGSWMGTLTGLEKGVTGA